MKLKLNSSVLNEFPVEERMHDHQLIGRLQCGSYDAPVGLLQPLIYKLESNLTTNRGRLIKAAEKTDNDDSSILYRVCRPQCIVQVSRKHLCTNKENVHEFNPQSTFWAYLILRVLYAISLGGAMVLFEGACLAVVIEVKGDLGLQRLFGLLGTMIFSPVSGALIDYFSAGQSTPDFRFVIQVGEL